MRGLGLFLASVLALAFAGFFDGVYSYNRPHMRKSLFVPLSKDLDAASPQQVSIFVVSPSSALSKQFIVYFQIKKLSCMFNVSFKF